jgi:arylsulfatase A-like enzyme
MQDVAPTLLEAAGLPIPSQMEGKSFWRAILEKEEWQRPELVVSLESTWQAKWSIRTNRYKLVVSRQIDFLQNPEMELYDLLEDPKEENNLAYQMPALSGELRDRLERWIADRLTALHRAEDPVVQHGLSLQAA